MMNIKKTITILLTLCLSVIGLSQNTSTILYEENDFLKSKNRYTFDNTYQSHRIEYKKEQIEFSIGSYSNGVINIDFSDTINFALYDSVLVEYEIIWPSLFSNLTKSGMFSYSNFWSVNNQNDISGVEVNYFLKLKDIKNVTSVTNNQKKSHKILSNLLLMGQMLF